VKLFPKCKPQIEKASCYIEAKKRENDQEAFRVHMERKK